jgi:NADH-quinone oxidoreductase subunit A
MVMRGRSGEDGISRPTVPGSCWPPSDGPRAAGEPRPVSNMDAITLVFILLALIFIAFDMEMAYMYPWAAVFKGLGWFAFAEIGFFLTVLGLGIVYAWREGALEWS